MSNRPTKKPSPSIQRAAKARVGAEHAPPGRNVWIALGVAFAIVLTVFAIVVLAQDDEPEQLVLDATAKRGEQVARDRSCMSCHSRSGTQSEGPTWKGLYGKQVTLTDGSTVTVDDAYLTRAIRSPGAEVVAGFAPMPTQKPMTDDEIAAITAYIKALQ